MLETNEEFDFTVWLLTSRDMPSIDKFLTSGEGSGIWDYCSKSGEAVGQQNKARLLEMREAAFSAYTTNNMPLMEATIEALFAHAENIGYRWSAHAKAVIGEKSSKAQRERAKQPRKLSHENIQTIVAIYRKHEKEGSVYGVVKELARKYNVAEKTITTVVKKASSN
jgi:hypothetical protein